MAQIESGRTAGGTPALPVKLHPLFSGDSDAKELGVLSCPSRIFHATHHAMLVSAGIRAFLPRSLIRTNADLFVDFSASVPENEFVGDVARDGVAFRVEQRDAVGVRRIKPII